MQITKASVATGGGKPTPEQLERINAMAKAELKVDQVYVFSVRLCDDQIDRDQERFDTDALPVLAKLFVGKSGVVDHQWSAQKQIARIFATEVQRHDEVSFIKAWAYIRRGGAGDEWIADIEAGIKKEVSVGCAMGRRVCSICGQSYGECGHEKGQVYDGQMCCAILREPMDAYEFSFVAVPAQPNAGVMKAMGAEKPSLKALAEHYGAQEEYRVLAELARLGREHQKALADQVVGLCLALDAGVEEPVLRSCAGKLSAQELAAVQKALEKRAEERYPVRRQLAPRKHGDEVESGYLI